MKIRLDFRIVRRRRCSPGALLVAFGVAAVFRGGLAAAAAATAEEFRRVSLASYLQVTDIVGPTFSPDGTKVAFSTIQPNLACNCQQVKWHVISLDDRRVLQFDASDEIRRGTLANGRIYGHLLPSAPLWSPDGTKLLYIKTADRRHHLKLYDLRSHTIAEIQSQNGSVYEAGWMTDGREALIRTYIESARALQWQNDGEKNGYRLDGSFSPVYQHRPIVPTEPGLDYIPLWQSDLAPSSTLAVIDLATGVERAPTAQQANLFDTAPTTSVLQFGRTAEVLSGFSGARALRVGRFNQPDTPDSRTVLEVDDGSGFRPIAGCDPCSGRGGHISSIKRIDIDRALFSLVEPSRLWLASLHELKIGRRETRLVATLNRPNAANGPGDAVEYWDASESHIVYVDEDTTSPPRLTLRPFTGGEALTLFDPNAELRRHVRHRIERVALTEQFGHTSYGHLVFPPAYRPGTKLPVVVVQYIDNGFLRGGTGNEYPVFAFADAGLLVLNVNSIHRDFAEFRKAQQNGTAPADDGKQGITFRAFGAMIDDELRRLVRVGLVDENRIAFTGLSAGSDYINFRLATGGRMTAAITSGDSADPIIWYLSGMALKDPRRPPPPLPGQSVEPLSAWHVHSPVLNIDKIHVPLLINSAETEYMGMLQLFLEMQYRGRPVEMYVYTDEHHLKTVPSHLLAIYERNVDWLKFWLRGKEDPDATKIAQYERWRRMRAASCAGEHKFSYCRHDTSISVPPKGGSPGSASDGQS